MSSEAVEPHESPLGRYDQDGEDGSYEVRLLHVPVRVLAAAREHHDEVMREFAMLALDERVSPHEIPARMLELIDVLGRRYGASAARPDSEVDSALDRGQDTIDLVYHVPRHVTDAATQLESFMAEADEFCRERQMLALERPKVVADFAAWYLEEFARQIQGEPAHPWAGPLDA